MKKDLRSAEILKFENFSWRDIIIFLMDTELEKMLDKMFSEGMFPEDTTTDEIRDLQKFIEKNVRKKI